MPQNGLAVRYQQMGIANLRSEVQIRTNEGGMDIEKIKVKSLSINLCLLLCCTEKHCHINEVDVEFLNNVRCKEHQQGTNAQDDITQSDGFISEKRSSHPENKKRQRTTMAKRARQQALISKTLTCASYHHASREHKHEEYEQRKGRKFGF